MAPHSAPTRSPARLRLAALAPLALVSVYLWLSLGQSADRVPPRDALQHERAALARSCDFPGSGPAHQRLVIAIVDSLRAETALDARTMPWLATLPQRGLSGRMTPCLSQLSLLCFRTMFEGWEPLLVTGVHNFTGMSVAAPSLISRWAARGIRVAAVADAAFIRLYEPSLFRHTTFEERPASVQNRDEYGRLRTFEWLKDPRLDVIISHTIDTDATAHRVGVGHADYVAKFRETDRFLSAVAAQLGPRDSLLILGDHGHDAQGYHSTGIPAETQYFATGPLFEAGGTRRLRMASLYFLAGAVTCETTPALYAGEQPFEALAWPPGAEAAARRATPPLAPQREGANGSSLAFDTAALACAVLCCWWLHLESVSGSHRRVALSRLALSGLGGALLWSLALGLLSPYTLVTLQNHVNPRWTLGFWSGLALLVLAVAPVTASVLAIPPALARGFTAWLLITYGLFLGPYYYGAVRNLLFGTAALLLAFALHSDRLRSGSAHLGRTARWLGLALLPTIPLLFPVMKEWQPRWILLAFSESFGTPATAFAALGVVGLASAWSGEPWRFRWAAAAVLLCVGLGEVTHLAPPLVLGFALLTVSYVAFQHLAAEFGGVHPSARWLVPIGQTSYALVVYWVMLGSLRFANVDFRFALAWVPMAKGEAYAAMLAVPASMLKYFVPVLLLLGQGPALGAEALVMILSKVVVLGAAFVAMEFGAASQVVLFERLQSQETALTMLLYLVLALWLSVRSLGRRRGQDPQPLAALAPEPGVLS